MSVILVNKCIYIQISSVIQFYRCTVIKRFHPTIFKNTFPAYVYKVTKIVTLSRYCRDSTTQAYHKKSHDTATLYIDISIYPARELKGPRSTLHLQCPVYRVLYCY